MKNEQILANARAAMILINANSAISDALIAHKAGKISSVEFISLSVCAYMAAHAELSAKTGGELTSDIESTTVITSSHLPDDWSDRVRSDLASVGLTAIKVT